MCPSQLSGNLHGLPRDDCPAVIADPEKPATYVIIGKTLSIDDHQKIAHRIGKDEMAIEIDRALVDEAVNAEQVKHIAKLKIESP